MISVFDTTVLGWMINGLCVIVFFGMSYVLYQVLKGDADVHETTDDWR